MWKNTLEIENFMGKSGLFVRQDCYATVLTNNLQGLLQWERHEESEGANRSKPRTYQDALNKNGSMELLLNDTLATLLVEGGTLPAFSRSLTRQMKRSIVPIRPGRRFSRKRKNR